MGWKQDWKFTFYCEALLLLKACAKALRSSGGSFHANQVPVYPRNQLPITTLPDTKQQGQRLGAVLSQKLGKMFWKTGVWMKVEFSLVTSVKPIMVCKALQEPSGTSLSRYYSLTRCNLILFFLLVSLFFLPFS